MGLLQYQRLCAPAATLLAAGFFCAPSPALVAQVEVDFEVIDFEVIEALKIDVPEVVGGVAAAPAPDATAEGDTKEETATKPDPDAPPLSPSGQILAELGFDPNDSGYAKQAAGLFLDPEAMAEVRKKIVELDAEDFRARNIASRHLAAIDAPIEHLLGAARAEAEIEMSRRIQSVLNVRIKKRQLDALYHAAEKIATDQEAGFVDRLLTMASTFEREHHWELMRVFEFAVARSARDQDEELLAKTLSGEDAIARELAAFALGYRTPERDTKETASRMKIPDGDDVLQLAAARGKAAAGIGDASEELVELLSSNDLHVRQEAGKLLRAINAKDFGFAAYDPEGRRAQAVGRWSNFIGNAPSEVAPVRLGAGARGTFRVLVGKRPGKTGGVLSYTTSGTADGDHPLSASMGSTDPNTMNFDDASGLVVASGGDKNNGRITVLNAEGNELWSISGYPAANGCAALPSGKLLVAVGEEVELLEVTGDRTEVWNLGTNIACFDRLRVGRYLCCHPDTGTVAEYGDGGELLWKQDGFNKPSKVTRLPNGNLLVVVLASDPSKKGDDEDEERGKPRLVETSPDGREIVTTITPKGVRTITCAARIPNGNTLIGTELGLAEYTPEGLAIKVWLKAPISSLHVR